MTTITKQQFAKIMSKAPEGSDPKLIAKALMKKGYKFDGLTSATDAGAMPGLLKAQGVVDPALHQKAYAQREQSLAHQQTPEVQESRAGQAKLAQTQKEMLQSAGGTFAPAGMIEEAKGLVTRGYEGLKKGWGEAEEFDEKYGKEKDGVPIRPIGSKLVHLGLPLAEGFAGMGEPLAPVGSLLGKVVKEDVSQKVDRFKEMNPALGQIVEEVGEEGMEQAITAYKNLPDGVKSAIGQGGKVVEAIFGLWIGADVAKMATPFGKEVVESFGSLFKRPVKSVDDVIVQASESLATAKTPSAVREVAEAEAPKIGVREKWAGVRPDIKKRIQGKQDNLKEYFDVAHARNLDDTLPTPLEHGARRVEEARDSLKGVLEETGSGIGNFRKKISTTRVGVDDILSVESTFDDALKSLNLVVKDGKVLRVKGKVAGKVSDSEIKLFQKLRDDIKRVKQSPTVENMIDLRNSMDNTVNFAKEAREASNVVDPVARATRGKIKEVNLKAIGKEQGKLLEDYSDLIGLLQDLNKYVDGRTGGEFLLKQVLSERGRIPRELMKKLSDYTGIDLLDDAVMAQLATEIIGNSAQKGLFRQEITKAGLDAFDVIDVISGAPGAGMRATKTLYEKGKGVVAPVEKTFLKAAESKPKVKPTSTFKKAGEPLTKNAKGASMDTVKHTPNTTEALYKEARKYKTAEEFVKAQRTSGNYGVAQNPVLKQKADDLINVLVADSGKGEVKLYHGTDSQTAKQIYEAGYFQSGKDYPSFFTTSRKEALEYANNKTKYRNQGTPEVIEIEAPKYAVSKNTSTGEYETHTGVNLYFKGRDAYINDVELLEAFEKIPTKSQLTDIWKKANQKD